MELCNPITEKWIRAYINRPATTLLINSPNDTESGVEIAKYIYSTLAKNPTTPLYELDINDKKSIGIDDIRDLQSSMFLKANSDSKYTRFALIPNAEKLTREAQNALLKLTEELPDKTIVMLVISNEEPILQTLLSRCFQIKVLPITTEQSIEYGKNHGKTKEIVLKSLLISEGNLSIFNKLLISDDKSIEETILIAKEFIKSDVFDRQKIIAEVIKKDSFIPEFIQALKLTSRTGMRTAKNINPKKQWKKILSEVLITENQLEKNVQSKLALLALSVRL